MILEIIFAFHLIRFTGLNNQIVEINPDNIVSIREPHAFSHGHFDPDIHCLIFTTDGKFVSVKETCAIVNDRLTQ